MKDQEIHVLEQYDINVNSTRKVRGAVLCDTKQGLMLLRKLETSPKRILVLCRLLECLKENGFDRIDCIVANREEQWISVTQEGESYVLKRWFAGKECDICKEDDVLKAVRNLAEIHRILRNVNLCGEEKNTLILTGEDLRNTFDRHNREMKKVRAFIRTKVEKGDFELLFLKYFDAMYELARAATQRLEASEYETLLTQSRREGHYTHGDYNYHNLLMTGRGIATTNFEHFHQDVQITDLYYFIRKTMEKNQWSARLCNRMLEAYDRVCPLSEHELTFLAICISYPEKFWKAANSYYRGSKVFIPMKSLEKLEVSVRQMEMRKQFLEQTFSFRL